MDRSVIEKIISAGAQAPSGSNSQPWRFEVHGNQIDVFGFPERDHPVLNFRSRGTWMAHGALIENVAIAAHAAGCEAHIQVLLQGVSPVHVARIALTPAEQSGSELAAAIPRRTTNRKPYARAPLSAAARGELAAAAGAVPGATVRLIDDRKMIDEVGRAVAVSERVMLENRELHRLFFEEIVWTAAEERAREKGLYLPTMEVPPPGRFALKHLFRHWELMRAVNALGVARGIAAGNAKQYAATPLMGVIAVPDEDRAFIDAGRAMERVWLTAEKLGLSFHLITGIFFFEQRFRAGPEPEQARYGAGGTHGFDPRHVALVRGAYTHAAEIFGNPPGIIAAVFRVGVGGEPSARSLKRPPEIVWR